MDPDIVQQLNDQLREMADLLSKQSTAMAAQVRAASGATSATNAQSDATTKLKNAENAQSTEITGNTAKANAAQQSAEMVDAASLKFSSSLRSGKDAILGFADAMISTTPGLTKYSSSVKGMTEATSEMVSVFGPLGKVSSLLLGALGGLIEESFKYSDAMVKGYDDIAKAGGAIGSSAEGILKLAHNAGLSTKTLGYFTKGVADLGDNIRSLGLTTSQGADTFGRMIAVGDQNLKKFRNLGYSQEDLIDAMAQYVNLQAEAGADMKKSPEELQKASLDYIEKLNKLAELTGISAQKQMDAEAQAKADANFQAYLNKKQIELRNATTKEEKDHIKAVIAAKTQAAAYAKASMGLKGSTAFLQAISTDGAVIVTDQVGRMVRAGYDFDKINRTLVQGKSASAELGRQIAQSNVQLDKQYGELRYAYGDASKKAQEGVNDEIKTRQTATRNMNLLTDEGYRQLEQKENELLQQEIAKENQTTGAVAQRGEMEAQERAVREAFDNIMGILSKQVNGLVMALMPKITRLIQLVSDNFDTVIQVAKGLAITFAAMGAVAIVAKTVDTIRSAKNVVKSLFGKKTNVTYITLANETGPKDLIGKALSKGDTSLTSTMKNLGGAAIGEVTEEVSQDGMLGGIVNALKDASKNAGAIIKGGAALGTGLVLIGGGAAAAIWLVGKAIPTFTDGLKSFNNVDGDNLKGVGIGMLGITGGILLAASGGILSGFLSLFTDRNPLQNAADSLLEFQKLPIDPEVIKENGEAAIAFSKAVAGASTIGAFSKISEGISDFFSEKPPYADFEEFSKLKINAKKVQNNATAFRYFADAMASYNGSLAAGDISTALANAVIKHFEIPLPLREFQYFSKMDINPNRAKKNALSFKYFSEAMSTYKGTDQGILDALNQLIGSQISRMFDEKGPVKSFIEFTNAPFGPNGTKNAKSFLNFAKAVSLLSGNGDGSSSSNSPGILGTAGNVVSSAINVGAAALGLVGGAVGGIISKIIKAESGGSATAQAKTSSAYGLGQFTKGTFEGIAKQKGSPVFGLTWEQYKSDPKVQMAALNYLVNQNIDFLKKNGIPVSATSVYLTHFLGQGGVRNLYRHANQEAISSAVSSAAYNANRSVFGKAGTVGGLKEWAGKKMGEPPNISQARYGGVFTGPDSGYIMELHGTEIVIPMDSNSILQKLSELSLNNNTEIEEINNIISSVMHDAKPQNLSPAGFIEADNEMREMLLVKFNKMLSVIDSKQSISKKMLRNAR